MHNNKCACISILRHFAVVPSLSKQHRYFFLLLQIQAPQGTATSDHSLLMKSGKALAHDVIDTHVTQAGFIHSWCSAAGTDGQTEKEKSAHGHVFITFKSRFLGSWIITVSEPVVSHRVLFIPQPVILLSLWSPLMSKSLQHIGPALFHVSISVSFKGGNWMNDNL